MMHTKHVERVAGTCFFFWGSNLGREVEPGVTSLGRSAYDCSQSPGRLHRGTLRYNEEAGFRIAK